jgi:CheY-like chemotaxis protein
VIIAALSLGVVVVASWGPLATSNIATARLTPSTSGAVSGATAGARPQVIPASSTDAGPTAEFGRAKSLVDSVGGGPAADRHPSVNSTAFGPLDEPQPLRVLIVDDHPLFPQLLLRLFQAHEWIDVVGCAVNGRDGVMLASTTFPEVVVMDLDMPVMNGIEATRQILANQSAVVLIVTGSSSCEHEVALAAGARVVLPKTIDPVVLIAHLQNAYLERDRSRSLAPHQS